MKRFNEQKILVVEDNYMSYKLLEAHLGRSNLKVLHAADGLSALKVFGENPDLELILMDIQLPGMNGLEATEKIREQDQEIPIIAATANVFDDDRQACMKAGCTDFVTKPINFPQLYELLEKHLL